VGGWVLGAGGWVGVWVCAGVGGCVGECCGAVVLLGWNGEDRCTSPPSVCPLPSPPSQTPTRVRPPLPPCPPTPVTALACHVGDDAAFVVSGGEDGSVRIWHPRTREMLAQFTEHTKAVTRVRTYLPAYPPHCVAHHVRTSHVCGSFTRMLT
jgi:hypothetical protein